VTGVGAGHVTSRNPYNNKWMGVLPLRSVRRRFRLKYKHGDGLEREYAFSTVLGGTTGSKRALSSG